MRMLAVRLREGQDLKQEIERFVVRHTLPSVTVISAVGSLNTATMRMADAKPDAQDIRNFTDGTYEIVSFIGNLGPGRTHLHMAISDREGAVIGGHVKEGCEVHTTVELVLAVEDSLEFSEAQDPDTGFGELEIIPRA